MEHSEQVDAIAAALVKAQAEIENAGKDGQGNFGRYATLTSVVDACKKPLADNGISFIQAFEPSDAGMLRLTTTLLHSSGQFISGTCTVPLVRNDPQSYGSAATYARRYSLAAMVGVCPDDDDADGAMPRNGARQPQRQPQRPPQRQAAPPRNMNPATGEVPANGAEKTVAVDSAAFAEYGDVMDDERFQEAVLNEMKKRSFTDKACIDAQASACRAEKVVGLGGFSLKRRHEFLMAIGAGFFDRFNVPQTNKATNRPAKAAAGK
jgi:hypothetical protein